MTDLDHTLATALRSDADLLDVPPGDLDRVMSRGQRRARHHRVAASVAVVALAAAGTVTTIAVRAGSGEHTVAAGRSASGTATQGETGISWKVVDTTAGLGMAQAQVEVGGKLYAVSTAPGPARPGASDPYAHVLYRSPDGVSWASTKAPDLYVSDLGAQGNRLYAVGTGQVSATTGAPKHPGSIKVAWSDDQAASWHDATLPFDFDAVAAKSTRTGVQRIQVAAGSKGVVAVALVTADLNIPALVPGASDPHGYVVTPTGVGILAADPNCPTDAQRSGAAPKRVRCTTPNAPGPVAPQAGQQFVASYTWAQLGVDGDLLRAVQRTPVAFRSTDGESFQRTNLPLTDSDGDIQVGADATGFVVAGTSDPTGSSPTLTVLHSTDGQDWTRIGSQSNGTYNEALGRLNGRIATIGSTDAGPLLSVLEDDGSWRTTNLTGLVDPAVTKDATVSVDTAAFGPLGVVAVASVYPNKGNDPGTTQFVLFSRDGATWASNRLDELAGRAVGTAESAQITADHALVAVALPHDPGTAPAPQVVLVGTLDR